jgi:hypothetical protein
MEQLWRNHKGKKNLHLFNINVRKENVNVAKSLNERTTLWHQRFSHFNMVSLKKLERMVTGMNLKKVPLHHVCEACIEANIKKHIFLKMKRLGLPSFRSLCIAMCANR